MDNPSILGGFGMGRGGFGKDENIKKPWFLRFHFFGGVG